MLTPHDRAPRYGTPHRLQGTNHFLATNTRQDARRFGKHRDAPIEPMDGHRASFALRLSVMLALPALPIGAFVAVVLWWAR